MSDKNEQKSTEIKSEQGEAQRPFFARVQSEGGLRVRSAIKAGHEAKRK